MDIFPPLNEAAGMFFTRTHKFRFSGRKILKSQQKFAGENPEFTYFAPRMPFFLGFHEIAFAWAATPARAKNCPFSPSTDRFFWATSVFCARAEKVDFTTR